MTRIAGLVGAALAVMAALGGCSGGGSAGGASAGTDQSALRTPVTVKAANGAHVFVAEIAKTAAQQEKGMMYRTGLKPDDAMLFWPYPAGGGRAQVANFWMKNTPSALDIIFIRADGTIARIAENAVPYSETLVSSGEPVAAVLEIPGGRAADVGIAEGDKVNWAGQ